MNNNTGSNNNVVPEAKGKLAQFKNEVANEMGVPFKEYNGDLSSKQCGSVGGEMVKRMVQQYENNI
ncbi:alpha/beta-type small acid-soluble spore protein [Clostridium botulinum]|uniref:Conserved domain protein n=1 Tax=Clostridium botulinum (strain Eklund 17B / Type B) TaxID=935198 RepID=B2TLD9_CLOBB|nr:MULTISPECIES: alpha/beta-type small acid-soluble spore protein [Clostridium]ACD23294.1 conserved domain protein [Clostridium botulinum B str. Eklund 17B (NRP)]AIY81884.1 small, acid-soluble spore protein C1 [Clostridium botulinum 202F]KAI3346499.1 alpha/beta-type small acid-soluble spore protein [Clostridium botulinum]KFX54803.1 spore protein [Clostridium botulinum]KFX58755.1 spore protein [Clostridium botulinum]